MFYICEFNKNAHRSMNGIEIFKPRQKLEELYHDLTCLNILLIRYSNISIFIIYFEGQSSLKASLMV